MVELGEQEGRHQPDGGMFRCISSLNIEQEQFQGGKFEKVKCLGVGGCYMLSIFTITKKVLFVSHSCCVHLIGNYKGIGGCDYIHRP